MGLPRTGSTPPNRDRLAVEDPRFVWLGVTKGVANGILGGFLMTVFSMVLRLAREYGEAPSELVDLPLVIIGGILVAGVLAVFTIPIGAAIGGLLGGPGALLTRAGIRGESTRTLVALTVSILACAVVIAVVALGSRVFPDWYGELRWASVVAACLATLISVRWWLTK